MNEDKAREAFEAHMKADWRGRESAAWRNPDGSYIYTESEWRAFQAALQWAASQQAAEGDPLDMPLPCDITVGHVTMSKGVPLRSLVYRMQALYELAQEAFAPPSTQGGADEQR